MKCIKCDGKLHKVTAGEVDVDQCDKCSGIWFDLGELEKLKNEGFFATASAFFKGLLG